MIKYASCLHRYVLLAVLAAGAVACTSSGGSKDNNQTSNTETMTVEVDGDHEVPPVQNTGSGSGMVTVDYDSGEITGSVTVSGLSGAVTAAHIHPGFAGVNGGVLIPLQVDPIDASTWMIPDATMLDATNLQALQDGGLYINLHTATNPNGEVRGQLVPANVTVVRTTLDGTQETPSNASAATGIGYLTVNRDSGKLVANVRTDGITATAAHIHDAPAGTMGGVEVTLVQDTGDPDVWATAANATLSSALIGELNIDYLYFNVHSATFPDGEIRGQIVLP